LTWSINLQCRSKHIVIGWLNFINENNNSLFLTIEPRDFLVHHALGLHTTIFILEKNALDARDSKLMPNKKNFSLRCILFGGFLDIKYNWMCYFLLTLKAHDIIARECFTV
jgi:hypothetical protein